MNINEAHVSVGKCTDTKGICIFVVNDDLTCNNIVSEMLQHCNYQVLHVGSVLDVLNAIWETKDNLDLVLTNAHKLESNADMIIQHIQKKLNLPIILMCADEKKILSKGQPLCFGAYVLEGLSRGDVNNLWQFALKKEKDKILAAYQEQNVQKASINSTSETTACFNQIRKTQDSVKDRRIAKKTRVVWTSEMHQRFLEAIEIIGYEKAVPKKIVEVMGIPGLSRENVASHLQKYRCSAKRTHEIDLFASSERKIYKTNIGNYNYVPQFQLTTDSYGDQTRNTLLKIDKNNSCVDFHNSQFKSGKFVGYRLSNNGNSIKFGNLEASEDDNDISRETQVSVQGDDTNKEKFDQNYIPVQKSEVFTEMAQSFDEFLEEAMLSGTDNKSCYQLDWEEFDDVHFEHGDD
ncbi:hypothetical protein CASFOL_005919 [Castilleja foliolosa]|uniref:Myb-like domain-containing protein n=1 Tax=Castilleja foliolosa TaxID=1961234 RepID=A0ABD3E5V4_9LAMI